MVLLADPDGQPSGARSRATSHGRAWGLARSSTARTGGTNSGAARSASSSSAPTVTSGVPSSRTTVWSAGYSRRSIEAAESPWASRPGRTRGSNDPSDRAGLPATRTSAMAGSIGRRSKSSGDTTWRPSPGRCPVRRSISPSRSCIRLAYARSRMPRSSSSTTTRAAFSSGVASVVVSTSSGSGGGSYGSSMPVIEVSVPWRACA